MRRRYTDYTGKKFNHLTLLHFLKGRGDGKHALWLARCDCGSIKEVVGKEVARGNVKTCGNCQYHREVAAGVRTASKGIPAQYRRLYARYVRGAVRREIPWGLTPEYCLELFCKECTYCGSARKGKYSGIDRISSKGGYTSDNTVSCCSICNKMKGTQELADFLDIIHKIAIRTLDIKKTLDKSLPPW